MVDFFASALVMALIMFMVIGFYNTVYFFIDVYKKHNNSKLFDDTFNRYVQDIYIERFGIESRSSLSKYCNHVKKEK